MYLVLPAFTSRPISLLENAKASVFFSLQLIGFHPIIYIEQTSIMAQTKNYPFKGPCIVKYMPIIVQQDATIYSLFMSVNRSTCFAWYFHPSSEAHVTVSTASGISKTVPERDWTRTAVPVQSRHPKQATKAQGGA